MFTGPHTMGREWSYTFSYVPLLITIKMLDSLGRMPRRMLHIRVPVPVALACNSCMFFISFSLLCNTKKTECSVHSGFTGYFLPSVRSFVLPLKVLFSWQLESDNKKRVKDAEKQTFFGENLPFYPIEFCFQVSSSFPLNIDRKSPEFRESIYF